MTARKPIVTYDETRRLSAATVRAVWLVLEEMTLANEQPGREEIWAVPFHREDMILRVKMKWAEITDRPAHYYVYADWLIHITFVRCRKMGDKGVRFREAVGRDSSAF